MFQVSKFRLGKATLKPILAAAVPSEATLQRFVGLESARFNNVSVINGIVEKAKDGIVGNAAAVANACLYLSSFNPAAAIEAIDNIQSQIKDPAVLRFAVGVRLRARNVLLDIKETALHVSGGATESEVSAIRAKALEDYKMLKDASPHCWLVKLAYAEFLLYIGKVDEALQSFQQIEQEISSFIEAKTPIATDVATGENSNVYSLIGLKLRRLAASKQNGLLGVEDPHVSNALQELQDAVKVTLTDEEATQLAFVLEAVHAGHHFMDYFPDGGEYDELVSPKADATKRIIRDFLHPPSSLVGEAELSAIATANKPSSFSGSKEELRKALESLSPNTSVAAALRAKIGAADKANGSDLSNALDTLTNTTACYETSGSPAFVENRKQAGKALARQMLYRTKVQIGVALTEKQKYHEAVDVISPVVHSNEYIYMWRAFLARSRAHKALGNITESDKDLKVLKTLKKSITDRTPYEKC